MKTKILYIEDEPNLGKIVYDTLILNNFEVVWEKDGAKVIEKFNNFTPDICLIDIMLPNIDGYQLCYLIKDKYPNMPIIFLTAKDETQDLIKGFEAGATEYIKKPFSIEELIIRINNQLNLHKNHLLTKEYSNAGDEYQIKIGSYTFFPKRFELVAPSGTVKLSNREGELIEALVSKGNQIIKKQDILLNIWGDDSFFNSRNLDVYIRKIRNYFKEDKNIEIQTLRGKGYLFIVKN